MKGWKDAYAWAISQAQGINLKDSNQISNLLKKHGWNDNMMDKFEGWGRKALVGAKLAKKVGIDPLKGMGIDIDTINADEIKKSVIEITGSKGSYNPQSAISTHGLSYGTRNTLVDNSSNNFGLPD